MIAVVDYGRGNVFSLCHALKQIGADYELTSDSTLVAAAERIILPGVGAFADCMENLAARGLAAPVIEAARRGTPLLGICVGCQILLEESEEFGIHRGLALIAGRVRRLPEPRAGDPDAIRIPNVGWRALSPAPQSRLFGDIHADTMMYFVHSYAPDPAVPGEVSARIAINGGTAAAAFERGRIYGAQFHPEKSGRAGLDLLAAFVAKG